MRVVFSCRLFCRTLTVGIVFLTSCDTKQSQQSLQSVRESQAQTPHGESPKPSSLPSLIESPSPSLTATSSTSATPSPQPPFSPTPRPTPLPTPTPTLKPTPIPTPIPTATPIPLHTFTRVGFDTRFEEYVIPANNSRMGPPGMKLSSADFYNAAYLSQLSVDQQTGDIMGLWKNYDLYEYTLENNLVCRDPSKNNCFQWPAWFVYNPSTDRWNFDKSLNTNGTDTLGKDVFGSPYERPYFWWYLNRYYQTSDETLGQIAYHTGLVSRLDIVQNKLWIYQMNDMPANVNGVANAQGVTPGIPYPPVLMVPSGWLSPDKASLGLVTAQNALTYSSQGLYFLESEYPDFLLRIHFYSFDLPFAGRTWTTKTFSLKTGMFRAPSILEYSAPQVAYSKQDDCIYFLRRNWEQDYGYSFRSLARIARKDVTP